MSSLKHPATQRSLQ